MGERGLIGWPTSLLLAHDARAPALLRRAICADDQCRQAIFAALAVEHLDPSPNREGERLASTTDGWSASLRDGSSRQIIEVAHGSCPAGFLGALRRIGAKPLRNPRAYLDLHTMFSDPAQTHRARALRHVGIITESTIQIVMALRAPFAIHGIVSRLRHVGDAHAFMRAVDALQRVNTKATDEAILGAVAALRPDTRLSTMIDRLAIRADVLPPAPLPADDEVRTFTSAPDLIGAGRRYRNCLRTKLRDVLGGQSAFVEFRGEVIVEFVRLSSGGFLWVGCHAPKNGPVRDEIEQAAQQKAAAHGIAHVLLPSPWQGFGACGSLLPDRDDVVSHIAA